jgi:tripartite-type tricarboxylate transporter receptor subunit TctC
MQRRGFIKVLAAAATIWPVAGLAQTYPSRPITLVVPFAAGGTFDVVGRIIATRMAELLGQLWSRTSRAQAVLSASPA